MELSARFLAFTTHGAQWVLWLLIGLSVISVAVALERFWCFATYRPESGRLKDRMRSLLRTATDSSGKRNLEALDAAMEGAKAQERLFLESNLAFLGTLGSNAPFIGLFGTVLGIIKAFHDLAGNQAGGPAVVMAGISEALVATAVGLLVAIPAVVAFNYYNRRVRTSMTQVEWMAQLALVQIKAEETVDDPAPQPNGSPTSVTWLRRRWIFAVVCAGIVVSLGVWGLRTQSKKPPAQLDSAPTKESAPTKDLAPQRESKPTSIPSEPPASGAAQSPLPAAPAPAAPLSAQTPAVDSVPKNPQSPTVPKKGKRRRAPVATAAPSESQPAEAPDAKKSAPESTKDPAATGGQ